MYPSSFGRATKRGGDARDAVPAQEGGGAVGFIDEDVPDGVRVVAADDRDLAVEGGHRGEIGLEPRLEDLPMHAIHFEGHGLRVIVARMDQNGAKVGFRVLGKNLAGPARDRRCEQRGRVAVHVRLDVYVLAVG